MRVYEKLQKVTGERVLVCHGRARPGSDLRVVEEGDQCLFDHRRIKTFWFGNGKFYVQNIFPVVRSYKPDAVLIKGAVRNLSFYPLIAYYKYKNVPVVVWGHGYSRERGFSPERNPLDIPHLYYNRLSDAYVCYTEESKKKISPYCQSDKLFVANNTIDVDEIIDHRRKLASVGKDALRKTLGLERENYLIFIGRLHKRKKVSVLLEAFRHLKCDQKIDCGLLIVGDGDQSEKLEAKATRMDLDNVHFVGEKYGEEAGRYLFASDVMVMPGWLGLAVNHSLAYGLPVVSQIAANGGANDIRGNAPEAAHVIHGETGFLTKPGAETLAQGISAVLNEITRYSERAKQYAEENLTIDRMMEGFDRAFKRAREAASQKA